MDPVHARLCVMQNVCLLHLEASDLEQDFHEELNAWSESMVKRVSCLPHDKGQIISALDLVEEVKTRLKRALALPRAAPKRLKLNAPKPVPEPEPPVPVSVAEEQ
jgi:hypothetical protein